MSYAENLWVYGALLFGIIVVPGMDMFFVLANALTGGRRNGLAATAGIMVGGAVHTLFGALGVGVVMRLAPWLYTAMILVGAAYMAWIGWTLLRSAIVVGSLAAGTARSGWTAFSQGMVTCLLNPKAYLFVLAVFPQFVRPQYGPIWSQALVMGIMTVLMQLTIYGGLALVAGRSSDFLQSRPGVTIWIGRLAGLFFILVAVLTAWHGLATLKV